MTTNHSRRTGRPRLDAGERERLLAEIAKLDGGAAPAAQTPTAPAAGPDANRRLRAALTEDEPAFDLPKVAEVAAAVPSPPAPEPEPEPEPERPSAPAAVRKSEPEPAPPPLTHPEPAIAPEPESLSIAAPGPSPVTTIAAATPPPQPRPEEAIARNWAALSDFAVDPALLDRNLVITARRSDPAHGAFDVLRTRLVQALAEKGWRRVAITSPTAGCGKSFTAINLAVTLSRYDQCRTILLDMDMRRPGLANYLGVRNAGSTGDFLRGLTPAHGFLSRMNAGKINIGQNLALGLNRRVESYAAELFQQKSTHDALAAMERHLNPEVVLYDLPPALAQDDVIAFRPHFDCILMVVGGGITTAEEVREATRRIGEDKPILGVVLNKAEVEGDYAY